MLLALRKFFFALILLQLTHLPAMVGKESHNHANCLCQLNKQLCHHHLKSTVSLLDRIALDKLSVSLCNCEEQKKQFTTDSPIILFSHFTNLDPFWVDYPFRESSYPYPHPFLSIWSPPS